MGYVAWSVVFGEQPTAAKWNILGENDASFNDGTGIADDAILTRHILAANITSPKLIEAFFRGRQQIDPSNVIGNSQATGLTVQFGWGQMNTTASAHNNETVTFPTAFSAPPVCLIVQLNGFASTAQANLAGFTTGITKWVATGELPTATNFRVRISTGDGTNLSAGWTAYSWIAIGAV